MKKLLIAAALLSVSMLAVNPAKADVRIGVGINSGYGYGGGYPGYYHGYYRHGYYGDPYGYPYYYGPPPVVYAPPVYAAPPPTVVYEAAPPTVVYAPPPTVRANQTSETFIDENGQTCRNYQATTSTAGPAPANGVACKQPDGSWRIVQ